MNTEKPLTEGQARKRLSQILNSEEGLVTFTDHADRELVKDGHDRSDCYLVLKRGGCYEPAEWEGDEWRYRFHTDAAACVVAFESETDAVVVTYWSKK